MKRCLVFFIVVCLLICSFSNIVYANETLSELEEQAKKEWNDAWGGNPPKSWEENKKEILGNISDEEFKSLSPSRKKEIIDRIEQQFNLNEDYAINKYWKKFIEEGEETVKKEEEEFEEKKEESGKTNIELYRELNDEVYRLMNEEGKGRDDPEVQKLLSQMDEIYYEELAKKGNTKELDEIRKGQYGVDEDLNEDNELYFSPDSKKESKANTLDDMFADAETLKQSGSKISQSDIKNFSNRLYNIFLTVGTVIAVIVGAVLGIQFMLASAEGKAEIKKMLVAYAVGCGVVFGAFGIWKIVVTILQNI